MGTFDEWEIRNFSCWNYIIHGDVIKSDTFYGVWHHEFYPRGVGGKGEHLLVKIDKTFSPPTDSELSFISSDGSVFCTRRSVVDLCTKWMTFNGPKFEEVIALIRENEPLHKDRLILRWIVSEEYTSDGFRTVIDTSSQVLQMEPKIFYSHEDLEIFSIRLNFGRGGLKNVSLKASKTDSALKDTKVKLELKSEANCKFLFRTSIWISNGDNIIRKYEDDCIVDVSEQRLLSLDITLEELFEKGSLTIMRCKIVSGRLFTGYCCSSNYLLPPHRITEFSRLSVKNTLKSTSAASSTSFPIQRDQQPENAVAVLAKDLMCLYQDQDFSDFELRCGTISFPTHRGILCARSPVFKAMLSGDMKEATCGHVEVEDLDPHTLGRFLTFLYSGAFGEEALQWEEASKLYYGADKYQVPSLKKECALVLCNSVSLENVCDVLSLADKHQDEEVRSAAHEFLLKNFNEVLKSEKWKKFVSSDPLLISKTVTSIFENKHVSISDSN